MQLFYCGTQDALKEKDERYRKLEQEYNSMAGELEHEKKLRTTKEAQLAEEKERHKNEIIRVRQQCDWYLQRLANRLVVAL